MLRLVAATQARSTFKILLALHCSEIAKVINTVAFDSTSDRGKRSLADFGRSWSDPDNGSLATVGEDSGCLTRDCFCRLSILSSSSCFTLQGVPREINTVPFGLRLLNHLKGTLNNSDPGTKRSAHLVLVHRWPLDSSSLSATPDRLVVISRCFPQLFGIFLLRVGTTTGGLRAQQTAGTFMNFFHASQSESVFMAMKGSRLCSANLGQFDEVISELAVTLMGAEELGPLG